MKLPIRTGCRAVILGAKQAPQNNGRLVVVGVRMEAGTVFPLARGKAYVIKTSWMVKSLSREPLWVAGKEYPFPTEVQERPYGEACIWPLPDDPEEGLERETTTPKEHHEQV